MSFCPRVDDISMKLEEGEVKMLCPRTDSLVNDVAVEIVNKKRSRTAIFSVNEAPRRLIVHTTNQFQKETEFWQK